MFGKRGKKVSLTDFAKSIKKEEKKEERDISSMLVLTYKDNEGNIKQAKTLEEITQTSTIKNQVKFMTMTFNDIKNKPSLFSNIKQYTNNNKDTFKFNWDPKIKETAKYTFSYSSKEYYKALQKLVNEKVGK